MKGRVHLLAISFLVAPLLHPTTSPADAIASFPRVEGRVPGLELVRLDTGCLRVIGNVTPEVYRVLSWDREVISVYFERAELPEKLTVSLRYPVASIHLD